MKNIKKQNKNQMYLILLIGAAVLGIALLAAGNFMEQKSVSAGAEVTEPVAYGLEDAERYSAELEKKITELCLQVKGADNITVVVTLKNSYSAVYAKQGQSNLSGYKEEVVVVGKGQNENGILIGYQMPEIQGIGIVCRGGGNPEVRQKITALVSASTGVKTNKIYVCEAES